MPEIKLFLSIILLAFICELVDSTLGMGYGTTLTPLLLIIGYEPIDVVPAILFSEFITGVLAGFVHHEFGNVNFRRGSLDFKIMLLMSILSIVGVLLSVLIAVSLPQNVVKIYIGALVFVIGLAIIVNHRRRAKFSWRRVAGLGFLAAFNKGISGGGYGPVVTAGQILSGVNSKSAIGITSLAEGFTSAVGVITYLASKAPFPWLLAPSLLIGAVLSVPFSALVIRWVPVKRLTLAIGCFSVLLGGYTLGRVLL